MSKDVAFPPISVDNSHMTFNTTFPIELTPGHFVESVDEIRDAIVGASDDQVAKSRLRNEEDILDFQMSCDALNLWRILLRLKEQFPDAALEQFKEQLSRLICEEREYDPDEFESAKFATENRVRSPFGLDPLRLAFLRAKRAPIRLLVPDLSASELASDVAAIARELQRLVGNERKIYLPIEQIRELLGRRKTVVSGTVLRLVDAGILEMVNSKYHTNRAREFRFIGVPGEHFEAVDKVEET